MVHGDTVYLAGQVATNTAGGSMTDQAREVLQQIDAEWDRLWHESCQRPVVSFPSNEEVRLTPEIQKLIARLAGRT